MSDALRKDRVTGGYALSSYGETTRTVETLITAQDRGSYTVAISNTAGSTQAWELVPGNEHVEASSVRPDDVSSEVLDAAVSGSGVSALLTAAMGVGR